MATSPRALLAISVLFSCEVPVTELPQPYSVGFWGNVQLSEQASTAMVAVEEMYPECLGDLPMTHPLNAQVGPDGRYSLKFTTTATRVSSACVRLIATATTESGITAADTVIFDVRQDSLPLRSSPPHDSVRVDFDLRHE